MDWKKKILEHFLKKTSIYIVNDIDEILNRKDVIEFLELNNINVLDFDDPVCFRYIYERNYRFSSKQTLLIRIYCKDFESLPWDVYKRAFLINLDFNNIFPKMDRFILRKFPSSYLNALYDEGLALLEEISEQETYELVLKTVLTDQINTVIDDSDVENLLRYYWNHFDVSIPEVLRKSLIKRITQYYSVPSKLIDAFFDNKVYREKYFPNTNFLMPDLENLNENGWIELAKELGKYRNSCLQNEINPDESVIQTINEQFQLWLGKNYGGLPTKLSRRTPIMVHHIPNFLERNIKEKVALIVMDGMSFTQWFVIQKYLLGEKINSIVQGTFAWIPSVTSVSRQAIFSGKTPNGYANSITTTNREEEHWKNYWIAQGFDKNEIYYQRSLGLRSFDIQTSPISYPNMKVFGGVIDIVDRSMHAALQGLNSVHSELEIWLKNGYLISLLDALFKLGFEIYITSDHGNVESTGIGFIREGVLAETNGQRMRIYENEILRLNTHKKYEENTIEWDSYYLPDDYKPLLADSKNAFVRSNDKVVSHGGSHIEEVIIPFVKLYRRDEN